MENAETWVDLSQKQDRLRLRGETNWLGIPFCVQASAVDESDRGVGSASRNGLDGLYELAEGPYNGYGHRTTERFGHAYVVAFYLLAKIR